MRIRIATTATLHSATAVMVRFDTNGVRCCIRYENGYIERVFMEVATIRPVPAM